ncbi:MAG: XisI protein [Microcoleaceae cyanobacterium]
MDALEHYRQTIENLLNEYAAIPYAHGEFKTVTVFDHNSDRYLLMNIGWDKKRRDHGCLVHIDIIDGKFWIQQDGTEDGIALDLEEAGIDKEKIVLGFREPELRPCTGYATV